MNYSRTLLEEILKGNTLTPTEIEVLYGASQGETAEQTGMRMHRTEETIKSHRKTSIAKLGARNLLHAVTTGIGMGILKMDRIYPVE